MRPVLRQMRSSWPERYMSMVQAPSRSCASPMKPDWSKLCRATIACIAWQLHSNASPHCWPAPCRQKVAAADIESGLEWTEVGGVSPASVPNLQYFETFSKEKDFRKKKSDFRRTGRRHPHRRARCCRTAPRQRPTASPSTTLRRHALPATPPPLPFPAPGAGSVGRQRH